MAQTMSPDEIMEFLTYGTRTGKLATIRGNGRAHVAPIWFVLDGEDLLFTTWHTSVKAKNMQRDPRVNLCVDDETAPYAFVIAEGTVTFSEDQEECLKWATRIGGRYMGEDQAEAFGKRNSVEGELLVRLTPTKYIAQKELAGW
jgi:PPOX class probable F420-dependent enzyme